MRILNQNGCQMNQLFSINEFLHEQLYYMFHVTAVIKEIISLNRQLVG
jgi:hypothetical protein